MKFAQKLAMVALAVTFLAAPLARAEQDETSVRTPAASKKKKKTKKHSKAHKAKAKAKGKAKKAAHHAARPKTHAPAPGAAAPAGNTGVPDPYSDVSNEKKDDLPPPANTEPKDE
jgi:Ni/Co efflux regulator RcnB